MSAPGDPRSRNGFGIAALVLGLFALLLSWTIIGGVLFGILALIFGLLGRARAKRGEATNGGMSVAGVVRRRTAHRDRAGRVRGVHPQVAGRPGLPAVR